jgi:DNA-binding XRE family transcriptional regulator
MDEDKKRPRTAPTAGGRTQEEMTPMPTRKRKARAPERGARIAAARRKAGLSQGQLAERLGLAKSTIARIELGDATPSVDVALAISRELDATVEALFGGGR